jgi:ATP synthase F1 delta subunit
MKKSDTQILVDRLLSQIFETETLKAVSMGLEDFARNKHLKTHAQSIVDDSTLNPSQKKRQLNYLLSNVENSIIQNFFSDEIGAGKLWIFDTAKIDYLDEFVQAFQQSTESIGILLLTTAVELSPTQIRTISRDLTQEFGRKIILNLQINQSIIGGIQVKIENYVFDFSIRTKFQQFQREWLASLEKTTKLVGRYDPTVQE